MKVFLIGFMGSGKTTAGKKLSAHLGWPFIDLDHVFERQYESTIDAYFTAYGEDAFRKAESELLKNTAYPDDVIISTGGGAPCFYDNMDWMNSQGLTIYIELPVKVLADRLGKAKIQRPVLGGKKGTELEALIAERLAAREPFYKQAQIITSGVNLSAEGLAGLM